MAMEYPTTSRQRNVFLGNRDIAATNALENHRKWVQIGAIAAPGDRLKCFESRTRSCSVRILRVINENASFISLNNLD